MDLVEDIRLSKVLPHLQGRILDLCCGYNNLVRKAGRGVGADAYPWPGVDCLVDVAYLPFASSSFDTVTIIAALNHIPNRQTALREVHRVLAPDGRLVMTMINPLVGILAHFLFRHDEDVRGGMVEGEKQGLWDREMRSILAGSGFRLSRIERFELGLNKVFLAVKQH